ncbi:hypothetical protein AQUCO_02500153v1 [Aquilegia coerulea]|uniref:Uncharacterized protein n=1 Tax=Aquilegia coerulea TaxID=218851 RepID=A0A2G5D9S4_AQUCA|nr:hypothetical protein AQUCO_02500153v1 [Aquilegia coerulea]
MSLISYSSTIKLSRMYEIARAPISYTATFKILISSLLTTYFEGTRPCWSAGEQNLLHCMQGYMALLERLAKVKRRYSQR